MLRLSIWIGLLIFYGTVLTQDIVPHNQLHQFISQETNQSSRTKRFGFSIIEQIRQNFCNSSICKSADSSSFIMNFVCAMKCPELYLPHGNTETNPEIMHNTEANPTIMTTPNIITTTK
ncbi:hypothetical protein PUN28_000830 [Cardiocondyla obscurior]|uniref:Uncharacterized protein n=1 Tax=Cardiocondyla obscurior TaxID=286306 RepID=A0AAW2H1Q0_9HYME